MERVILRHLKGSKASQLEEFPLQQFAELVFGRDPNSSVRFDPEKDDLVGRQHARIAREASDPYRFKLVDLNSRNGTFLNKLRVVGEMPLQPGDVIQLGAGGPEIQFDLDPLPAQYVKATRLGVAGPVGATVGGVSETRVSSTSNAAPAPVSMGGGAGAPNAIGKATVERMIGDTKKTANRKLYSGLAAATVLVAAVALWQKNSADAKTGEARAAATAAGERAAAAEASTASMVGDLEEKTKRAAELSGAFTPAEIAAKNVGTVVQIEMAWHLIHSSSGGQAYHLFIENSYKARDGKNYAFMDNGRRSIPAYISIGNDVIEPYLTLSQQIGRPIGVLGGGTGFVTKSDGFILTNRHVAANWRTPYEFDSVNDVGILVNGAGQALFNQDGTPAIVRPPRAWIPSETKQDGPKGTRGQYEGRTDYLNVSFPKNTLRLEAQVARVSDRHDVALIKISTPQSLPTVTMHDSYNETQIGEPMVVLGYPMISPEIFQVVKPKDGGSDAQLRAVPDPTLTDGTIAKVIRASDGPVNDAYGQYNPWGDSYQLNINTTGAGNSGGPVIDAQGRVIGVYSWGRQMDVRVSYAVPIRYALELMTVSPNAK